MLCHLILWIIVLTKGLKGRFTNTNLLFNWNERTKDRERILNLNNNFQPLSRSEKQKTKERKKFFLIKSPKLNKYFNLNGVTIQKNCWITQSFSVFQFKRCYFSRIWYVVMWNGFLFRVRSFSLLLFIFFFFFIIHAHFLFSFAISHMNWINKQKL